MDNEQKKELKRQQKRTWYATNKERVKNYNKQYYSGNKKPSEFVKINQDEYLKYLAFINNKT